MSNSIYEWESVFEVKKGKKDSVHFSFIFKEPLDTTEEKKEHSCTHNTTRLEPDRLQVGEDHTRCHS